MTCIKKNAQKKHKKREVDEKYPNTTKKNGTPRLFSHTVSQRLLPKGGRGKALHLSSHLTGEYEQVIITTRHS